MKYRGEELTISLRDSKTHEVVGMSHTNDVIRCGGGVEPLYGASRMSVTIAYPSGRKLAEIDRSPFVLCRGSEAWMRGTAHLADWEYGEDKLLATATLELQVSWDGGQS